MNVFEDLIGELKDENLLEDTVIQVRNGNFRDPGALKGEAEFANSDDFAFSDGSVDLEVVDIESDDDVPHSKGSKSGRGDDHEFFRKRAIEEVSSLQMVQHVLGGVEREYMNMEPAGYDELQIKKALHQYLQVLDDIGSDTHADAEYALIQETQSWHTALSTRDKNISVANIRQFCENSRPVLSAQALMALARFYRNSPFTEEVRGKFDFVMTRLFSRVEGDLRKLLFGRLEMIGHIKTLYGNWSSISYHAVEDHKSDIDLAVQRFDDLTRNFDGTETLDELLNADVFQIIRSYKEECSELFYVPDVAAAAIDCNVQLGNKYVKLVQKARARHGAPAVEEKYGPKYDQAVSNATGKTLSLVELLRDKPVIPEEVETNDSPVFEQESFDIQRSVVATYNVEAKKRSKLFGVNKWLVAATILIAMISGGVYLWADKYTGTDTSIAVAKELSLEGSDLKNYLQAIRVSNDTAYGLTNASWDTLNESEQKDFAKKVYTFAQAKGLKRVNLLNSKGRTVAFVTHDRLELYKPT